MRAPRGDLKDGSRAPKGMAMNLQKAIEETNRYYEELEGMSFSDEQVDRWLGSWFFPFVSLSGRERILDLCCGDGCWSFGLLRAHRDLSVVGVEITEAGVRMAQQRAEKLRVEKQAKFLVHDCERDLPFPDGEFDLCFARGPFLFNQHDMLRLGCLRLLDHWHCKLKSGGRFVAMYGSKPDRLGLYTPPEETILPMNLSPRTSESLCFMGGKYNHTPASFWRPFSALPGVEIVFYQFSHGIHILVTKRQ